MEAKFVSFEDAIEKLGISSERLHALREGGDLRAYRDGKSWKFRTDEIESMVEGGVPEPSPPSDIGLVPMDELVDAAPIDIDDDAGDGDDELGLELEEEEPAASAKPEQEKAEKAEKPDQPAPPAAEKSDLDLELNLDDTDAIPGGNGVESPALDDTVTAGSSDLELASEAPEAGPSDSILLSEETLGESVSGSPSTIIGKDKIGSEDDDLELALATDDESGEGKESDGDESDVKLASSAGASDVLSSGVAGSGVLDELDESGGTSAFKDLEELELDLAAESGPALASQGDLPDAKPTKPTTEKKTEQKAAAASDFDLDDLELEGDERNEGSTGAPVSKVEGGGDGSEIDLTEASDDMILDEGSGGSDLTLDSGDSGINLISPGDSGLALDDIPLEMGGSAILSSLSLEGSDPEISLIGDSTSGVESGAELQTDDDFQLTPLSEAPNEDGDSSSQVIALDDDIEALGEASAMGSALGSSGGSAILDESAFAEADEDDVVLSDDFAEAAPAGDLDMGYAPSAAVATLETPYSLLNILGLGSSAVLLLLATTMMLDMMRNIWSWDETYSLNSSLMDAILGWF